MHNSQKNILVSKREFNTQSSATPKKLPLLPTNQESQQNHYSNHKSTSIENSNMGTGVSYSQLQIILQNVQNAKKKAAEHIHGLQNKNKALEEQLVKTKDQVKKYVHLEETIKAERRAAEHKYQGELVAAKQQLIKKQDIIEQLNHKISQLQKQLSEKSLQLTNSKQSCTRTQIQLQKISFTYNNFTKVLQITESSHEFRHIVDNYGDIPKLLDSIKVSEITKLSRQTTIQELKTTVEELRVQIQHNNKLINSISEQNKNLVKLVAQTNQQKLALSLNLKQSQQQVVNRHQQSQSTVSELQGKILQSHKQAQQKLTQKQQTIITLKQKIGKLEQQLIEAQQRERNLKAQSTFKAVVDEVCNQFQDYENVMNRLKYLEKIRSQFYFNVEKIQYLCKMLDE